ncbi:MAG: response regulator [bacterium]|jgi:DNA-binding NtrC family response regulator|nr:response regulator [bacterium]|tara:strand:- start:526 stop:909 length:384 start_codon:yes stop_codon:yes gene_type:complete
MSRKYSLWIIDDDEGVVKSLVELLNDRGHKAAGFTDVWKIFSELSTDFPLELPEVAIIDMVNHQMPGWQICKKFRESLALKKIKLVAMSGILESEDAERMKLTADAFIRKPFSAEDLETTLDNLFMK